MIDRTPDPTPAEIEQRCEEIQSNWTSEQRERRAKLQDFTLREIEYGEAADTIIPLIDARILKSARDRQTTI